MLVFFCLGDKGSITGVLTIRIGKLGRERRHKIPTGAIFGSHDRNGLLDGTNIDIKASDSIEIDMFNWEHSTPKKVDASPHGESHTHNAQHIRHRRLSPQPTTRLVALARDVCFRKYASHGGRQT